MRGGCRRSQGAARLSSNLQERLAAHNSEQLRHKDGLDRTTLVSSSRSREQYQFQCFLHCRSLAREVDPVARWLAHLDLPLGQAVAFILSAVGPPLDISRSRPVGIADDMRSAAAASRSGQAESDGVVGPRLQRLSPASGASTTTGRDTAAESFCVVDHANGAKRSAITYVLDPARARTWTVKPTLCRAQSVPKRSGTSCLLLAYRGTNGQVRGHTTCVTCVVCSGDNAEVGGSIPPSAKW
jgi:hypothetical protein